MAEQTQQDNIDYTVQAEKRHRTFIARTAAALSGVAAYIAVKRHMVTEGVMEYIYRRLNQRDYTGENTLHNVFDSVIHHRADTYNGAPTRQETIERFKNDPESALITPGTSKGDDPTFRAYRHIISPTNQTDKYSPFAQKLLDGWSVRLKKIREYHDNLISNLEKQFFDPKHALDCKHIANAVEAAYEYKKNAIGTHRMAVEGLRTGIHFKNGARDYYCSLEEILNDEKGKPSEQLRQIRKLNRETFAGQKDALKAARKAMAFAKVLRDAPKTIHWQAKQSGKELSLIEENAFRAQFFKALDKGKIFKDNPHSFFEKKYRDDTNFMHWALIEKEEFVDKPIFRRMAQSGMIEPGQMGIGQRQILHKGKPVIFGAVAGVFAGAVAYKFAKAYLNRNDNRTSDDSYFQSSVLSQREAQQQIGPTARAT